MIPHYSVLANVIQVAHHTRAKDESQPLEKQRYKPGSKLLAGECVICWLSTSPLTRFAMW